MRAIARQILRLKKTRRRRTAVRRKERRMVRRSQVSLRARRSSKK